MITKINTISFALLALCASIAYGASTPQKLENIWKLNISSLNADPSSWDAAAQTKVSQIAVVGSFMIYLNYNLITIKRIYHDRLLIDLGVEFDKPVALFTISEYSPKRIYHDRLLIDLGVEFDKPVALFTISDLCEVPTWNADYLTGFQPTGHIEFYALYKSVGAGKVTFAEEENCGNFANWIDENLIAKLKNTAIWFGKDHWCPVLKNGVMEIVVANIIEIDYLGMDGKMTKTLTVSSAVWRDGSFGKPSAAMKSVFQ